MGGGVNMTPEERAAYREQKRQDAEERLDALLTEEGWANWLRLRRSLHTYSWTNQVLIATAAWRQARMAHDDHPDAPAWPCAPHPTVVKAAWKWKRDGYHPAKGTRGLLVWVRQDRLRKDGTWVCCGQTLSRRDGRCPTCQKDRAYFVLKPTFDASQVVSFDTGEPPNIELPEGQPIEGDHPGDLLVGPLAEWALEQGLVESLDLDATSDHGELGSFNQRTRHLRVVAEGAPNARLRVLIHELAHALGVTSARPIRGDADGDGTGLALTYAEAEVAVGCVSYMVASVAGLDTSSESIPYMAGWGGEDARQKVRALAQLIDTTAKRLEAQVLELLADRTEVVACG